MDLILLLKAAVMGIVEGLTEFLPISSTGHLILAGSLLNFTGEKVKVFEIVIQAGAILAVCWEYRARLLKVLAGLGRDRRSLKFVLNLIIAFLPAAVLGLLFSARIKETLFSPLPVALAFIIGGIIILLVERQQRNKYRSHAAMANGSSEDHADHTSDRYARIQSVDDMTPLDALKIGLAQSFALIPGTSRSGATIIGGMLFGLSRKAATEFSFFLAIPTLLAATFYSLYKARALLSVADVPVFGVGTITSFIAAFLCVRWLLRYISSHDFTVFAWYRIVFGLVILATAYSGMVAWVD